MDTKKQEESDHLREQKEKERSRWVPWKTDTITVNGQQLRVLFPPQPISR